MDTYAKAQSELAEIDSRIAALQQRRDALRKFIDLGQSLYGPPAAGPGLFGLGGEQDFRSAMLGQMLRGSREQSAKATILAACVRHIQANGATSTRDLLSMLDAQRIEVTGADKINALSVMLSKSDLFESSRKLGWSMKDSDAQAGEEEATPQGAPTPAGSDVSDLA